MFVQTARLAIFDGFRDFLLTAASVYPKIPNFLQLPIIGSGDELDANERARL
jgi:hypothetical protein